MRTVLKGKTQEFIQGGITPSGLATQVRRGIIKGFDATTYRATVQLLGSLSVWLEGVPVAKHIGSNLLSSGARCGVLFFDESNPSDACLAFVYDGAPGPWITSGLVVDGAITAADCLSNVAGGLATIDASGDLNPPNHVRAAGRLYPGGQGNRYIYDAGATSGLAVAGGPLSSTGYIYPGTGSGLQSSRYLYDAGATSGLAVAGGPLSSTGYIYPGTGSGLQTSAYLYCVTGSLLAVSGSAGFQATIQRCKDALGNQDTNTYGLIKWEGTGVENFWQARLMSDFRWSLWYGPTWAGRAEKFNIDTGGHLSVTGYIYPGTGSAFQATGYITATATGALALMGGSVGIGTTSPQVQLSLEHATNPILRLYTTGGVGKAGFQYWSNKVYLSTLAAIPLAFEINASEKMILDASGNLGIGHYSATGPSARLHPVKTGDEGVGEVLRVCNASSSAGGGVAVGFQTRQNDAGYDVIAKMDAYSPNNSGAWDSQLRFWVGSNGALYGAPALVIDHSGNLSTLGYIYPGTGSATQGSRYIRDDGDRLLAYGGFKIDVSSGDTPLVFQRAGAYKWTNYVYAAYDDIRWAARIGSSWYDRMVLDDGSGNLYIDGTYNTFSPVPPKENMSPEDYLAWALEDASKPPKPYPGVPKEPAEVERYGKDISKIAIGVARYVDHLRTQVAALEARLTQAGL